MDSDNVVFRRKLLLFFFIFIYGAMCGGNEQICEQMRRLRKSKLFSGGYLWSHCWYLCTEARVGAKLELKVFRS